MSDIAMLKDKDGNVLYPQTIKNAVLDLVETTYTAPSATSVSLLNGATYYSGGISPGVSYVDFGGGVKLVQIHLELSTISNKDLAVAQIPSDLAPSANTIPVMMPTGNGAARWEIAKTGIIAIKGVIGTFTSADWFPLATSYITERGE